MTEITLDREQDQIQIPRVVTIGILVVLMAIMLAVSVSLLKWAVGNRMANLTSTEGSQLTIAVREKQLGCLAKNIYHEAATEPFEGKVAVAQVTLNRVASGKFPPDICQTIYQKNVIYEKVICQFSWACDRVIVDKKIAGHPNYKESMEVAKKVLLEDFRLPALTDALYYHADYVNPGWRREKVAKIGRHIFYK